MRDVLRRLAPGTPLREALDRIRRSGSGGLIVLGHDPAVRAICDGGVDLDVEFGPALLRELSKMDGAVVLSTDGTRLRRANDPLVLLARAAQSLSTLERQGARTARARAHLDRAEIGGYATVRDVVTLTQRMLRLERLGTELADLAEEMGEYGRQTSLQLDELLSDTSEELRRLVLDHLLDPAAAHAPPVPTTDRVDAALARLDALSDADLLLPGPVARCLGLP